MASVEGACRLAIQKPGKLGIRKNEDEKGLDRMVGFSQGIQPVPEGLVTDAVLSQCKPD